MNIFERAARAKLRFSSVQGELTCENLFDLPLTATGARNSLDKVAREVHSQLKSYDEISFVEEKPNPEKVQLELKMEIIKHIIESKKSDAQAAETKMKKAQLKGQLEEILAKKQGAALENLSPEEIQKKLAELAD